MVTFLSACFHVTEYEQDTMRSIFTVALHLRLLHVGIQVASYLCKLCCFVMKSKEYGLGNTSVLLVRTFSVCMRREKVRKIKRRQSRYGLIFSTKETMVLFQLLMTLKGYVTSCLLRYKLSLIYILVLV